MTGWLAEWLKDIVLIVLIAAFLDLLIPNSALQRYVKVVVSLMITLTILQPVISVLQSDEEVRKAAKAALGQPRGGFPELSAILGRGGQLKLEAESRSADWAAAQLEGMIRQRLYEQFAVKTESVKVGITIDQASGAAKVSNILIILAAQEDSLSERETTDKDEPSHVQAVDSIEVNVLVTGSKVETPVEKTPVEEMDPSDAEISRRIKSELQEWLGVSGQIVEVYGSDSPPEDNGSSSGERRRKS